MTNITYKLTGAGWAIFTLTDGDNIYTMRVSYIDTPIGRIIDALLRIKTANRS